MVVVVVMVVVVMVVVVMVMMMVMVMGRDWVPRRSDLSVIFSSFLKAFETSV